MKVEGNFLQIEIPFQVVRNKKLSETVCPLDNELSKMHEAEIHELSDSVLCLGKSAMASPEIKFIERWEEHVLYHKDTAKRYDGKQNQFIFHISGTKKNQIVLKIGEWIRQGQGEDGLQFTPENLHPSSYYDGNDESNSDFFTRTESR